MSLFNIGMATGIGEKKILNSNLLKSTNMLKSTDLVSHPTLAEGLGKYIFMIVHTDDFCQ